MYEETGIMPAALANRPQLEKHWDWPIGAWSELSGTRQQGMSSHSLLAFSEVALYGYVHGCDKQEIGDLWETVHAIDIAWSAEVTKSNEVQSSESN